jgi:hypothetical protein
MAFLIGGRCLLDRYRIEQAHLSVREKLLDWELRLAEWGEKSDSYLLADVQACLVYSDCND